MAGFNVPAKAGTYLNRSRNDNRNGNGNGNSNGNGKKQIRCGDDNKKDKDNCVPSPSF